MDAIRVAKVEGVLCSKPGHTAQGTLHLTAHHLIFRYDSGAEEEMWVPYPLISLVTRLPQTLQGQSPLTFHCRTFRTFSFSFRRDSEASDVFESVRELTVASSVSQLYAFFYVPNPPFAASDGWSIYSPREEYLRMGVGSRTKAWRFTDINKDYSFCPTYPARLIVPTRISDATLQYASKYRSKCRVPALVYLHWANYGTITRSSQPMVGLTNNRSIQDEKLIEAIFQSHHSPESRGGSSPVYGATTTNLIIDARPTTNAMANVAKGAGTENMDHYKEGKKAYLGVDNIHVMRDSLNRVVEALREADALAAIAGGEGPGIIPSSDIQFLDRQALRKSGWLRHMSAILDGTVLIVRNVHVNSSHVLIHCSDGWDRTAQMSSLAQLCLDPYYRTVRGFQVLIEKDWLSFGHKFLDRCGHLSSDKFFLTPAEVSGGGGADAAQAAQAFLASVQNKLAGQNHLKEISPVFHQFLECVRQIQRQYPERFEFNGRFLEQIHYHLYSCQFGTFLFNCERERRASDGGPPPCDRTISVWDLFTSPAETEKNMNPVYDASLDDPARREPKADMGVLIPNPKDVRFWHELYGRTDEEMNGRLVSVQAQGVEMIGPVEGIEDDPVVSSAAGASAVLTPLPVSPSPSPAPTTPYHLTSSDSSSSPRSRSPAPPSSPGSSSSLPDMTPRPSAPSRQESFLPFGSTTSAFSLRSQRPNAQLVATSPNSSREPTSPSRGRTKPDLFGSGGMKSMWGKLSTNATAAYSVVQGAYGGVSKELRGMSGASGSDSELNLGGGSGGREGMNPLEEEADRTSWQPAASFSTASGTSRDTWRVQGASKTPSIVLDNPWGTSRVADQRKPPRADDIFSTPAVWAAADPPPAPSPVPIDPTVAYIAPIVPAVSRSAPSPSFSTSSRNFGDTARASDIIFSGESSHSWVTPDSDALSTTPRTLSQSSSLPPASSPPSSDEKQSDPLGVGLL